MATRPIHATRAEVVFIAPDDIDQDIASAWEALAYSLAEPNCFMERWFLQSALNSLDLPASLRLAFVWDARGQLIGMMPVHVADHYGRMPIRHVRNWTHYNCFLGIPLVRAGCEQAFWTKLLSAIDQEVWAAGLIHLTDLTEGGPVHNGLLAATTASGRPCDTVLRTSRAMMASRLDARSYFEATVRKKKRKEIKRLQARLAELGTVSHSIVTDVDEAEQICDAFLALERSGWKGESGSALQSEVATERFFNMLVLQGLRAGRVEIHQLRLDQRPIAMLVNFIALPGSFSFKIAYDEEFARFSPGVLIQIENMVLLERKGFGWMDSCAVEDHPMINSLWGQRRKLVWVTIPLLGRKRELIFRIARMVETGWAAIKNLRHGGRAPANDNRNADDAD